MMMRIVCSWLVLSFSFFLASCGSTRSSLPSRSSEELTGLVLVIEELPDGQIGHSWRRAAEVELSQYERLSSIDDEVGRIIFASRRPRDCDQEQIECHRDCMKRRLPSVLSHIKRGSHAHVSYCERTCLDEYEDCLKLQGLQAQEFSVVDDAVDWLKRHSRELLAGTIVVIAGVTFVVVSAGAGVVVLAPVVLVASADQACIPWGAGVLP
jgi:hypothetical protein